ncbi:endo-1,4-beta-xylanase [Acidipila sp. EB88]|nr:endo-1,4-beta-xylanase [Acidipila sp. EB88]
MLGGAGLAALQAVPGWLHAAGATGTAEASRWAQSAAPGQPEPTASFTGDASLKAHAAARGLFVGAAVNLGLLTREPGYRQTLIDQCNIVVAENAMKWAPMRPAPDQFFFDDADRFVAFAEEHGMAVRGHNLCWHEQLPPWFAATVNKQNAEQYLVQHIKTVMTRYKGKIRAWDVVNEAIKPEDGKPEGLRDSPWYRLLGPRYLEIAFRTARSVDPAALLTYNDYDIETDGAAQGAKRQAVMGLITRLKQGGVPIDALGVQSHLSAGSASKIDGGLAALVAQTRALGMKVFITELDVNDDSLEGDDGADREKSVAGIYGSYVGSMLSSPAVTDVLCWGVADRYSWLNSKGKDGSKWRPKHPDREEVCLPFDNNYQPHPAFFALRAALGSRKA